MARKNRKIDEFESELHQSVTKEYFDKKFTSDLFEIILKADKASIAKSKLPERIRPRSASGQQRGHQNNDKNQKNLQEIIEKRRETSCNGIRSSRKMSTDRQSISNMSDVDMQSMRFSSGRSSLSSSHYRDQLSRSSSRDTMSVSESQLILNKNPRLLPIIKLRNRLIKAFKEKQILIVYGEPGSGKSTQLTQFLYKAGFADSGKIGCTQTRAIAAKLLARKVASEMNCELGDKVGYSICFDDCTRSGTAIKYLTDGVLLREFIRDPDLKDYSVIVLDEVHERSANTDVLCGLLRNLTKKRPEFKLIITSPTIPEKKLLEFFKNPQRIEISGQTYPKKIIYCNNSKNKSRHVVAVDKIMEIHQNEAPGDILVFLTGEKEIKVACEMLSERIKSLHMNPFELIVVPFYATLSDRKQMKTFAPTRDESRKVVITTNIAETSLTIDGIVYVIDSGYVKLSTYNPDTDIESSVTTRISQAAAIQRIGRAGRTGPGKCYRLYTKKDYDEMQPKTEPEILRVKLDTLVMQLKKLEFNDLNNFDFMDRPPVKSIIKSVTNLQLLSALTLKDDKSLTPLGQQMCELPLEPRMAKMIFTSISMNCSNDMLTIVAMLSVPDVFSQPMDAVNQKKTTFNHKWGDHLTLLEVYARWERSKFDKVWCEQNFVYFDHLMKAKSIREQLVGLMKPGSVREVSRVSSVNKFKNTLRTIAACSYIAKKGAEENEYVTNDSKLVVFIHPTSVLADKEPLPKW